MNAALFKKTSIRRWAALCPIASIGCVALQSQLSTRSGYGFGDDDCTSKSKVHLQRSTTSRFGRRKDPHFAAYAHSANTSAIAGLFN
jgi:hypothetical protein